MKNLFTRKGLSLDEIVFEGRNQAYGAYDLRMQSDRMLTKSLLVGVALFGGIALTPLVINQFNKDERITTNDGIPYVFDMTEVDPIIFEDKKKEERVVSVQEHKNIKTVDTQVPTPTREAKIETKPATIKESEGAIRGFSNLEGETITQIKTPEISEVKVEVKDNNSNINNEIQKPIDRNEIKTVVDENADFVGGINLFREKVMQNFDISSFEGSDETLKATVTFVVERNGSISNIKVNGKDAYFNKETEQVIRKIGGKWKPAKVNGEFVRSYFSFPVSMRFE